MADDERAHAAHPGPIGPGAPRGRLRRRGGAPGDPRNIGWLYVLPGLAFYVLFTLAPLLHTVYYSLFDWDGLTPKTWVGLANYGEALRDSVLRDSFVHSAILIVYYAVFPVIIGLVLTAALTRALLPFLLAQWLVLAIVLAFPQLTRIGQKESDRTRVVPTISPEELNRRMEQMLTPIPDLPPPQ